MITVQRLVSMPKCTSFVAIIAALASSPGWLTTSGAQEQKTIRIMVARSISAVPMLSIGPFAEKYGLKTEVLPFATNGEMQNALRAGSGELGQLGQQSPAILADQGATNAVEARPKSSGAIFSYG